MPSIGYAGRIPRCTKGCHIVPGTIVPQADRIAHVAVKLSSIVAELRKNIGDLVEKNEVLAILESRELADAKSEYLAARLTNEPQQDLFEREVALGKENIKRAAVPAL